MTINRSLVLATLCGVAQINCISPVHAVRDADRPIVKPASFLRSVAQEPTLGVWALACYTAVNTVAGIRQYGALRQAAIRAQRVAQAQAQMRGRGFHTLRRLPSTQRPHVPNKAASMQEIHSSAWQSFELETPKLKLVETPVVAAQQPAVPFMSADTEAMFEAIERARC